MVTLAAFGAVDWGVLLVYLAGMVAIGWAVSRKQDDADDFFLGGRRVPAWAAAISVLGTALSAATFIGAPQDAFTGNLAYLSWNIGGILGACVVAWLFIPAIYRAGKVTIYGFLDDRLEPGTAQAAAVAFLGGRLLASGARLFMAGIAFSLILFGRADTLTIAATIVVLAVVGTAYTAMGGIRAVIWTDVVQVFVVVGAAALSIVLLVRAIGLPVGEIVDQLRHFPTEDGGTQDKLVIFDWSFNLKSGYNVWGAIAMTAFNVAAFGCDHDLAQRLLTTKSSARASATMIGGIVVGLPVTAMFMIIGLLLAVFYLRHPELAAALDGDENVYPQFLVNYLPAGLSGLAMAGLLAAALSSFDSAINAMAATWLADVKGKSEGHASRRAVVVMGVLLMIVGLLMMPLYALHDKSLLNFALGVMTFAYTGLLGVFLTALLLPGRGHRVSAITALACGAVFVVLAKYMIGLGLPWIMLLGTVLCFFICAVGKVGYHRDPEVSES